MNYRNIIYKATNVLQKKNQIQTAKIDAELLLSISLNSSRENILLNLESKLNKEEIKNYNKLIKRRKNKEPVSQIEGKNFLEI